MAAQDQQCLAGHPAAGREGPPAAPHAPSDLATARPFSTPQPLVMSRSAGRMELSILRAPNWRCTRSLSGRALFGNALFFCRGGRFGLLDWWRAECWASAFGAIMADNWLFERAFLAGATRFILQIRSFFGWSRPAYIPPLVAAIFSPKPGFIFHFCTRALDPHVALVSTRPSCRGIRVSPQRRFIARSRPGSRHLEIEGL